MVPDLGSSMQGRQRDVQTVAALREVEWELGGQKGACAPGGTVHGVAFGGPLCNVESISDGAPRGQPGSQCQLWFTFDVLDPTRLIYLLIVARIA